MIPKVLRIFGATFIPFDQWVQTFISTNLLQKILKGG